MREDYLEEVIDFLKSEFRELNVVVMPDFFLDRLISLKYNVQTFSKNLRQIAERKGGSIDGIEQTELRGGNAVNTASALATLGVKVTPIICTDKLGLELIKYYFEPLKVNLSHIKIFEKPSITTALELETESGKVNVMLRDVGALADFGPKNLDESDFEVVEKADYVCVFNWAGTRRFGTQLAKTVFRHVKTKGEGKTYYDTADPAPNIAKTPELVKVLQGKYVDILSVNENEAVCYASQLNHKTAKFVNKLKLDKLAMESAKILASHLPARIDLHTTSFAATFTKKDITTVSAFKVPALRATGAGDAWNAGNILGDAFGLSDGGRLALANLIAAYYISNSDGMHPTRKQLIKFCAKLKK
ncbi:carbohydrate kinase family protein [Candidatus Bathyarchaeota archaeon]|nr:carbohydrate kinase family protein [Candidatus Bathyarchaeota archaeon]